MRSPSRVGLIWLALILPAINAAAEELPDALEVVGRINARDEGLTSSRNIRMELIDRSGDIRTRETVFFRRYVPGLYDGVINDSVQVGPLLGCFMGFDGSYIESHF